jgi:hypothetical protein
MKQGIFLLILILLSQATLGVRIEEVLYDPINTENGGEAILIYNEETQTVDVSGWTIATKASIADAILPPNTSISAGGYLLIADNGFSLNKDNSSWPNPGYEEAITLGNTDAGVALMNGDIEIDAVGWGNTDELYRGNPHLGVLEGQSLRRINNTNNNAADFVAQQPIFTAIPEQSSNLELIIEVEINITNSESEILSFEILLDENSSVEGIQIKPLAGETKKIPVKIEVKDIDGIEDIENLTVEFNQEEFELIRTNINETNALFEGNISIQYYEEPGSKILVAQTGNVFFGQTFEYDTLAAMNSENNIDFELSAGNELVKIINVTNLGNIEIQLSAKGTDIFQVGDFECSTNNFNTSINLNNDYQNIGLLSVNEQKEISIKLNSYEEISSGTYNGQIKIKGET